MNKKIWCCFFALLYLVLTVSACSSRHAPGSSTITTSSSTQASTIIAANDPIPPAYSAIIHNIIQAFPWNDDELTIFPENPELSYLYRHNSSLSEIGYAFIDLDQNGQKEMVIFDVNTSTLYDLYTLSEGRAIHLVDGGERNYYFLYENGYVENQWSGSAVTSGYDFYRVSAEALTFVDRIVLDAFYAYDLGLISDLSEATESNCLFRSKSMHKADYQPISSQESDGIIHSYRAKNLLESIEYTLLSEHKSEQ